MKDSNQLTLPVLSRVLLSNNLLTRVTLDKPTSSEWCVVCKHPSRVSLCISPCLKSIQYWVASTCRQCLPCPSTQQPCTHLFAWFIETSWKFWLSCIFTCSLLIGCLPRNNDETINVYCYYIFALGIATRGRPKLNPIESTALGVSLNHIVKNLSHGSQITNELGKLHCNKRQ